MAKCKLEGLLI